MKLIFATITGSKLYGTDRPDSDTDIRGVCLNPVESLLGLTGFEQYNPNKTEALDFSNEHFDILADDVTIYGLNKFTQLLMDANPNILELLYAPNLLAGKTKLAEYWSLIVANRHLFLSTKIVHTFAGYAYSQLQRIKGHKRWIDNPPAKPNPEDYGMVLTDKGGQKWTDSNKYNQYQSLIRDYNGYETWLRERNPARRSLEEKFGYDTKHAMHLERLILEAADLLTTGELVFPLPKLQLEYLKFVLAGGVPYDDIVGDGENVKDRLLAIEKESTLPKQPNRKKIEELLIGINLEQLYDHK